MAIVAEQHAVYDLPVARDSILFSVANVTTFGFDFSRFFLEPRKRGHVPDEHLSVTNPSHLVEEVTSLLLERTISDLYEFTVAAKESPPAKFTVELRLIDLIELVSTIRKHEMPNGEERPSECPKLGFSQRLVFRFQRIFRHRLRDGWVLDRDFVRAAFARARRLPVTDLF